VPQGAIGTGQITSIAFEVAVESLECERDLVELHALQLQDCPIRLGPFNPLDLWDEPLLVLEDGIEDGADHLLGFG